MPVITMIPLLETSSMSRFVHSTMEPRVPICLLDKSKRKIVIRSNFWVWVFR